MEKTCTWCQEPITDYEERAHSRARGETNWYHAACWERYEAMLKAVVSLARGNTERHPVGT